jgi:hypothetical protein
MPTIENRDVSLLRMPLPLNDGHGKKAEMTYYQKTDEREKNGRKD